MSTESPSDAPPDASAAHAVARLARHVDRALGPLELTTAQFRALGLLAEGASGATRLAARLAVSAPNVTGLVDGLVARGLAERTPDPLDRRRQALALTAAGETQLRAAEAVVATRLAELAGRLEDDEASHLLASLARWNEALDAARDTVPTAATVDTPRVLR